MTEDAYIETLVLNELFFLDILSYVGHPISSDNGLISQKLLLKSEFYYPLHVIISVAYSSLKYGVFITVCRDLMVFKFVNNTVKAHGHEYQVL